MDVAGRGNYILAIPYLLFVVGGVVFIMIAMRDRKRSPPSVPNLMARRKHPLRHVQVEINRARKEAKRRAAQPGDETEKPEKKREGRKGPFP